MLSRPRIIASSSPPHLRDRRLARGSKASYHIGVITSDLGALGYVDGSCKPDGLGGRLQPLGAAAPADCVAPQGAPYITIDQQANTDNINGIDWLPKTLSCMTAVGDQGCGFEQTLESLRVALLSPANAGFLRDDALLVIAILTDEDDCSTDDDELFTAPVPNVGGMLGYRRSFRCSRFGLTYAAPGGRALLPYASTMGPVADPRPATKAEGGRLFDLSRYIDLLTKPRSAGGIKDNPNDVIIGLISAPPSPVEVLLASPNTALDYTECVGPINEFCQPVLQRSCSSSGIVGDPAVRLHAVATSFPSERRVVGDLCASSYQTFADELMAKTTARLVANRESP